MPAPTLRSRLAPAVVLAWLLGQALCLPGTAQAAHGNRSIANQASLRYLDPAHGTNVTIQSNVVVTESMRPRPVIQFFTNDTYARPAMADTVGRRLYIQAQANACNQDPHAIDSVMVTLTSAKTGDTNRYQAVESDVNSGIFRTGSDVVTASGPQGRSATSRPQMTAMTDMLDAGIDGCGDEEVHTQILIDPSGVVFDAATGELLAGAQVTLIDVTGAGNGGNPGGPAVVFDYDGVTPWPSQVTSNASGRYSFPLVPPSVYRLDVVAPYGHVFPSTQGPAQFPTRVVVAPGSYGGNFPVNAITGDVTLDVPLDPMPRGLTVQKTASRSTVEIAESLGYTVSVKNVGEVDLTGITVRDDLPAGFAYLPGSARMDGVTVADPQGGRGPALTFPLGNMAVGASHELTYRVVVGPGALQGDGINRAQAVGSAPLAAASNRAAVKVTVQPGVFSDKAAVLGTVFADCNANGVKDADEPGAPGVRLTMEDGSYVITDGQGRYSFYGVRPRTHVLKVDPTTLPAGAVMSALSQRHAGDGNTRFVDPHRGEMHRADFALAGCAAPVMDALKARQGGMTGDRELAQSLRTDLRPEGQPAALGDLRALPARGVVGESDLGGASAASPAGTPSAPALPAAVAAAPSLPPATQPLEALVASMDAQLGFIGLADGDVVPALPLTLRVKGRQGAQRALAVNGQPVGDDRVGQRAADAAQGVELSEYVGVLLKAGENELTLTERDGFGNVRATRSLRLRVAGDVARVVLAVPTERLASDGTTLAPVTVTLQDTEGLPVMVRVPVTLQTSLGEWEVRDLDLREPGVQTFVEVGSARFGLRAPATAGDAELRVTAASGHPAAGNPLSAQARVSFVPQLRPMMAVGVIEGVLNLRKLNPKSLVPARPNDGFEQELREFAGNGATTAGARAAMFLKGKVRGDYLLTLGFDSDKDTRERLFRDIQPDEFYPVYGDSSVKGFDAQSTSRLYVRVERNKSYLLYGDFTTQTASQVGQGHQARQLGAYQRSLTGVKEHYETDRLSVTGFASRDSTRQIVQELPGNGTSGPYALAVTDAVANSERIEILVRDRFQRAVVLRSTPQRRFTDYDFEPLTGRVLFRAPVPSLDADLNPVSIRVTYEAEQGGAKFWVAGAEAQYQWNDWLTTGASVVRDWNPLDTFQMGSVNAELALGPNTRVTAEVAQAERDSIDTGASSGSAQRVELQHQGGGLTVRAHAGEADAGFDNLSSSLSSGRREAGLKSSYALNDRTRLLGDATYSLDDTTDRERSNLLLGAERSFDGGRKLEGGVRLGRDTAPGTAGATSPQQSTSVRAKLSSVVPGLPMATAYVEAEQDVSDTDRRMLALGGDYRIANRGRIYVRHEFVSSLSTYELVDGAQRHNTTVLGVDGDYMQGGRAFSEYRGRDAFDGREAEAAMGLRNQWSVTDGVRLNTSFERVQALVGTAQNESTAVTGAIEYTRNPLWKGTARLELRNGATSDSLLSTLGLAYKISSDWTFLGKNVLAITRAPATATKLQERLQLGAAFRDTQTNRMNGLGRYEFRHEQGGTLDADERTVHMVSTHLDYQPRRAVTLTGQYAAKWVQERFTGLTVRNNAQLFGGRATMDVAPQWDVGVAVRMLTDAKFQNRQSAVGGEVGHQWQKNLWVSVGYNVTGFKDRDLSAENYTQRGAYVRLRFKFDETLLASAQP